MKKIIAVVAALLAFAMLTATASLAEGEKTTVLKTDVVELREEWQSPEEPCSSEQIIFEMLDDTNAILTDRTIQSESMYYDLVRIGTYLATDYGYLFVSDQPFADDEQYRASIVPDEKVPGRIEGMTYEFVSSAMKDIAGIYTGKSDLFGDAVLVVEENSTATLTAADGKTITGNFNAYKDGYDFFANIGDEQFEDYYIELNGDTFTAKSFGEYVYGPYAGTFTAKGDLGPITFTVSGDGNIEADAVLEGKQMHLTGSINTDDENKVLTGCWLYAEDGTDMSLGFEKLADGTWNYYGTYSKVLAAG